METLKALPLFHFPKRKKINGAAERDIGLTKSKKGQRKAQWQATMAQAGKIEQSSGLQDHVNRACRKEKGKRKKGACITSETSDLVKNSKLLSGFSNIGHWDKMGV